MTHPNRNWRRRARDAAERVSIELREKRWQEPGDKYLAQLMAWEAYMIGYQDGRARERWRCGRLPRERVS